jgi:hypothetical protein
MPESNPTAPTLLIDHPRPLPLTHPPYSAMIVTKAGLKNSQQLRVTQKYRNFDFLGGTVEILFL